VRAHYAHEEFLPVNQNLRRARNDLESSPTTRALFPVAFRVVNPFLIGPPRFFSVLTYESDKT